MIPTEADSSSGRLSKGSRRTITQESNYPCAAGREVFAFINNLAKNGDHYWVLAHVTPSRDRSGRVIGYHSNRRVPSRRGVAAVQDAYQLLLAEERRHARPAEAAERSLAMFLAQLQDRGLTYDEYVWQLIDLGKKAA